MGGERDKRRTCDGARSSRRSSRLIKASERTDEVTQVAFVFSERCPLLLGEQNDQCPPAQDLLEAGDSQLVDGCSVVTSPDTSCSTNHLRNESLSSKHQFQEAAPECWQAEFGSFCWISSKVMLAGTDGISSRRVHPDEIPVSRVTSLPANRTTHNPPELCEHKAVMNLSPPVTLSASSSRVESADGPVRGGDHLAAADWEPSAAARAK
ncbi:unnamed protein product [Pleuronectes platessa]|uniref:Uncharacterized protein n=1 Tax=Pleuronectes platessa TaxID=8262 RepID=A0A9N7V6I1_PLEPL|nr:unnamed protein product [Pleuronectes platessa]